MIGSPDLLAFTGTEGFGEGEEDPVAQGLPEELSVPLLPPPNPWSTCAQFHRDFILVAEFSEQVRGFHLDDNTAPVVIVMKYLKGGTKHFKGNKAERFVKLI